MSGIFGALNLNDSDRVFNATVGQRAIYDIAVQYVQQQNAALNQVLSVFVDETTEEYKRRYKLPGGGRLQRTGQFAAPGSTRAIGSWDVAFPLEDFGAQVSADRVTMGYMTVVELERHINTVVQQNVNTVRFEMLKALFNSSQDTFVDTLWGSLSIEPLANGDSVTYPPVLGSESEATENHYLETGYASASVSDSNDPYETIIDELDEHFGVQTGGSEIVAFINNAQRGVTSALTDFESVPDRDIQPGQNTAIPINLPALPGRTLGRHASGCWIQEWRWVPANYILAVHMGAPKPLVMRADPADTGLPRGLALVAEDMEHPFRSTYWAHRFGFGCGNRLNGVVVELGTGGSYTIPTAYQ